MPDLYQLPKQFLPLLDKIASTQKMCIAFERGYKIDVQPWHSNLGICAYLPCDMEYPISKSSHVPLQFLGQINFAEIPRLEHFPETGIVQFYLNMQEMDLGIDEDVEHPQINHRVLYFPHVIEDPKYLWTADALQAKSTIDEECEHLWVEPSCLVNFKSVTQYMTFFDYRFAPLLFGREQVEISHDYDDLTHAYEQYQIPYTESFQVEGGHRIGGYANYLHATDNRSSMGIEHYLLLLQLDTDEGLEWCDGGIAQWYIHPDDLKKRDFSKVIFLWACH